MNFSERLMSLRRKKGLSQEELGHQIGVSRQTVSKWELGQSFPDFQRLVSLSDYFEITLDELVKDINVQDIREKTKSEERIEKIYDEIQIAKKAANLIINSFAIIGIVGISILLGFILFLK